MHETEKIEGIPERRKPDVLWLCASAAITVAAFLFRFYDLTLKPLHHDEGVNGFFLTTLFRTGVTNTTRQITTGRRFITSHSSSRRYSG